MKLTNPTDAELNAAFAEHVAAWKRIDMGTGGTRYNQWKDGHRYRIDDLAFTISADAVLPWLNGMHGWEAHYSRLLKYHRVTALKAPHKIEADHFLGEDAAFSKAAVIALLRAHGVEVEFSP